MLVTDETSSVSAIPTLPSADYGFPAWRTPAAVKVCAVGHRCPGWLSRSFVRGALHLDSRASVPHLHHDTAGDLVGQYAGGGGGVLPRYPLLKWSSQPFWGAHGAYGSGAFRQPARVSRPRSGRVLRTDRRAQEGRRLAAPPCPASRNGLTGPSDHPYRDVVGLVGDRG
jgi:hypothetical protein